MRYHVVMNKKVFWLTVFAIAFGFVECSVVIYLRKIYYGDETLLFPLKVFEPGIFTVELFREAATIIMLYAISAAMFEKRIPVALVKSIVKFRAKENLEKEKAKAKKKK